MVPAYHVRVKETSEEKLHWRRESITESEGRLNQWKRVNCAVAGGGREIETDGENRIAMVMPDRSSRWSSGSVCEGGGWEGSTAV